VTFPVFIISQVFIVLYSIILENVLNCKMDHKKISYYNFEKWTILGGKW